VVPSKRDLFDIDGLKRHAKLVGAAASVSDDPGHGNRVDRQEIRLATSLFPRSAWEHTFGTLRVRTIPRLGIGHNDAERRRRHSHAERGNEITTILTWTLVVAARVWQDAKN